MSFDGTLDVTRYMVLLVMQLAAPILIVGLLVGLLVSVLQAVTQVQEQTLSFVPKMAAMGIAAILFLPWLSSKIVEFAQDMFGPVPLE